MSFSSRTSNISPTAVAVVSLAFILVTSSTGASLILGMGTVPTHTPSLTWEQTSQLTPDDVSDDGRAGNPNHAFTSFGSAVSLDAGVMAVGTGTSWSDPVGWVYIFVETTDGEWRQVQKITPPSGFEGQRGTTGFGAMVAVDGDAGHLVVGQPGFDAHGQRDAGAAHIYEREPTGEWTLVTSMVGPNHVDEAFPVTEQVGPRLGIAVAVEDGTVAIGARTEHIVPGSVNLGAVYLYQRGDADWNLEQKLVSWDEQVQGFGFWIDIQGDEMLISASAAGRLDQGAAYIYELQGDAWVRTAELWAPDPGGWEGPGGDCFGFSVHLSGDAAIIGDPCWDSVTDFYGPSADTGKAYIFERTSGKWALAAELHASDAQSWASFGSSVAIEGDTAIVGAETAPPQASGAAYIYTRTADGWTEETKITGNDTSTGDWFGWILDMDQGTAVVGAPFDDNREDGSPAPVNDQPSIPPCVEDTPPLGCNVGDGAGSVYLFEPNEPVQAIGSVLGPSETAAITSLLEG